MAADVRTGLPATRTVPGLPAWILSKQRVMLDMSTAAQIRDSLRLGREVLAHLGEAERFGAVSVNRCEVEELIGCFLNTVVLRAVQLR